MKHWIRHYATAIVAVSEGAMASAWRDDWINDPRCSVIYNGVNLNLFQKPADGFGVRQEFVLPADCKLVIHVGSMTDAKNHIRLIEIFSLLHQINSACRLLIVGRDSDGVRARIEERARAMGVAGFVHIAGEREDIARLLSAADVMIFPSKREGLPGAVLEACASGVPVVASPLAGILEIGKVCSSVTCVSLKSTDAEWAAVANVALAEGRNRADLAGGPFDLTVAGAAVARLYAGAPQIVDTSRSRRVTY